MVAIFTGLGAGFERGSGVNVGADGVLGQGAQGRAGEGVSVNAATGNLILSRRDEFLIGLGQDVSVSRTYNSLGARDENGDNWRQSTDRRIVDLSGTPNAAGSSVTRVSADGSEIVYSFSNGAYRTTEGAGTHDVISYAAGTWTWTDGDTDVREEYSEATGFTQREIDRDGHVIDFTYTGNRLTRIEAADGGFLQYSWSGDNITAIETFIAAGSGTPDHTLTRYRYDASGRLAGVDVDLDVSATPNSIADGRVYRIDYTYDGTSNRVETMSQTDGSLVTFGYDAQGRVTSVAQRVALGETRTTLFAYADGVTTVTGPDGVPAQLRYNPQGQLRELVLPEVGQEGRVSVTRFDYDADGNVTETVRGYADYDGTVTPPSGGADVVFAADDAADFTVTWVIGNGYTLSDTTIDGRTAVRATKTDAGESVGWTTDDVGGVVGISNGDTVSGEIDVQGVDAITYSFDGRTFSANTDIEARVEFLLSDGSVAYEGIANFDGTSWTTQTMSVDVPTGAVSAMLSFMSYSSASDFDFAIDNVQVTLPGEGVTPPPPPPGGGEDVVFAADDAADFTVTWVIGNGYALSDATIDGRTAVRATKTDAGESVGWSPDDIGGVVAISNGDTTGGEIDVQGVDAITYSFDGRTFSANTDIEARVEFLLSDGSVAYEGFANFDGTSWTTQTMSVDVPTGAVSAMLSFMSYSSASDFDFAVDNVQVTLPGEGVSGGGGTTTTTSTTTFDLAVNGTGEIVLNPTPETIVHTYDARGNMTSLTDASGNRIDRFYDASDNLIRETRTAEINGSAAAAVHKRYAYDAEGHLRFMVDETSRVTEYRYNANGLRIEEREYVSDANAYRYDWAGSGDLSINALQQWIAALPDSAAVNYVAHGYDVQGRLTQTQTFSVTRPDGSGEVLEPHRIENFVYDSRGNLLRTSLTNQSEQIYTYDGLSRRLTTSNLHGGTTSITFDDPNNQTVLTTSAGLTRVSTFNLAGQLISTSETGADIQTAVSSYVYDAAGRLRMMTDPSGEQTFHVYDARGRKTGDINARGELTEFRYNNDSELTGQTRYGQRLSAVVLTQLADPALPLDVGDIRPATSATDVWAWTIRDESGRVIQSIGGDGSVTAFTYDDSGQLAQTQRFFNKLDSSQITLLQTAPPETPVSVVADLRDVFTRTFYDKAGLVLGTLGGDGTVTRNYYDSAGQLYQVDTYADRATGAVTETGTFQQIRDSIVTTSPLDVIQRFIYNKQGYLRYSIDGMGFVTETVPVSGSSASSGLGLTGTVIRYGSPINPTTYSLTSVSAAVAALPSTPSHRTAYTVYAPSGEIAYSVDPEGKVTAFDRDDLGNVIAKTEFGVAMSLSGLPTLAEMAQFRAVNLGHSETRRTVSYYDAQNKLKYQSDGEGYVTGYAYDSEGRKVSESRYTQQFALSQIDTEAEIDALNKGAAVTISFAYDSADRLYGMTAPDGVRSRYIYDGVGNLVTEIMAVGVAGEEVHTSYTYDLAGNRIREERFSDASGANPVSVIIHSYDGLGNRLTTTDARNNVTSFEYDEAGRMVREIDPDGGIHRFEYDAFGNAVVEFDKRGNRTDNEYDRNDRLVRVDDPEGHATIMTYTAFDERETVQRGGNTTSFAYDRRGLLLSTTDGAGHVESFTYNALGQRISMTNKVGGTTTYLFDKAGRVESETLPMETYNSLGVKQSDTVTNRFEYDSRGNRTRLIEASGLAEERITNYEYDSLDRLTATVSEAVAVYDNAVDTITEIYTPRETYSYDARGHRIEMVGADGARTLYYYDRANRLSHEISPTGRMTRHSHDANGNVVETRVYATAVTLPAQAGGVPPQLADTPLDRVTTFTYDSQNRMLQRQVAADYVGRLENGVFSVVQNTNLVTNYQYDLDGNVVKTTDPNGIETFSYYDGLNRKTDEVDGENYLTSWTYDADGKALSETRFSTRLIGTQSVVSVQPPASVTIVAGQSAATALSVGDTDRVTEFVYDGNGNRVQETRKGVIVHDQNGTYRVADSEVHFQYDGLGNITNRFDNVTGGNLAAGEHTVFNYDSAGRMVREWRPEYQFADGSVQTPEFVHSYDGLNNRVRSLEAGWSPVGSARVDDGVTRFNYDGAGRLVNTVNSELNEKVYRYDRAGRLIREEYARTTVNGLVDEAKGYSYDLEGRLTSQGILESLGAALPYTDTALDQATTTYNVFGDVASQGLNGVNPQIFEYNRAGQLWRTTADDGVQTYFVYDAAGNRSLVVETEGRAGFDNQSLDTVLGFWASDAAIATSTATDVKATLTAYDGRNQATSVLEPQRQLTAAGPMVNLETGRGYNAFGDVISETDASGSLFQYQHNSMGRVIQTITPVVDTLQVGTNNSVTSQTGALEEWTYHDLSGRTVAMRDANGNVTVQTILAGTGLGDGEALITKVRDSIGYETNYGYDRRGNQRSITDQLGRQTLQVFDKLGRLTQINHAGGLVEQFEYDQLGNRIRQTNNDLSTRNETTTDYDGQGRVIEQVAFNGDVTSFTYAWNGSLQTILGAGSFRTFGGWTKTTTIENGRTQTEAIDQFGRLVDKTDLGGFQTVYNYDNAGRLSIQTGTGTEDITNTYFNTGKLASTTAVSGPENSTTDIWSRRVANYGYDAAGNLVAEALTSDGRRDVRNTSGVITRQAFSFTLKDATAVFDALGRMTSWDEGGSALIPESSKTYGYDANGNIVHTQAKFYQIDNNGRFGPGSYNITGTELTSELYFTFDQLNRVVIGKGALTNGVIDVGWTGTVTTYDAAGQRRSLQSAPGWSGTPLTEFYSYDAAGRLDEVREGSVSGTLRSDFTYDVTGRVTRQIDYSSQAFGTAVYDKTVTYDSKGVLQNDIIFNTVLSGDNTGTFETRNRYFYNGEDSVDVVTGVATGGSAAEYALGNATMIWTDHLENNDPKRVSRTLTDFTWQDGPQKDVVTFRRSFEGNAALMTSTTNYTYNDSGQLAAANALDGRSRLVTYDLDLDGKVINRDENDIRTTKGDPREVTYHYGGQQMGFTGNNGTRNTNYSQSVAERTTGPHDPEKWAFSNGTRNGVQYADFAQSPDLINSFDQGSQTGTYTASDGETPSAIASQLYGDGALWYKIAQANGLSGDVALTDGQVINLPAGVTRNTHSAATFQPYDPGAAIGQTDPVVPKREKPGLWSTIGTILLVAIAAIVTSVVGGVVFSAVGSVLGKAAAVTRLIAGGVSAAIGSVVSQGVGVVTGIQDKFDWKSVGLAGIAGGIGSFGAGRNLAAGVTSGRIGQAVIGGAIDNAATQGLSVVLGLQSKFDFAGVAAAAVGGGVGELAANSPLHKAVTFGTKDVLGGGRIAGKLGSLVGNGTVTAADAIASAATRSVIEGTNFGDNVLAALPSALGNTIGNEIGRAIEDASTRDSTLGIQDPQRGIPLEMIEPLCFVAGTPVHTVDGIKPIEDIRVGDYVRSRHDGFGSDAVGRNKVTQLIRNEDRDVLDVVLRGTGSLRDTAPETIRATLEHPFAVDVSTDGSGKLHWIGASDLRPGMSVVDIHGGRATILTVTPVSDRHAVYNMTVETDHTYFVGEVGVWVHNSSVLRDAFGRIINNPSVQQSGRRYVQGTTALGESITGQPITVTSGGGLHGEGLVNGRDVRAGYGQGLVNSTIIDPLNGAMIVNPYAPRGYQTQIPRMQPQNYDQSIGQAVGQVHGTVGTVVLPSGQIARAGTGARAMRFQGDFAGQISSAPLPRPPAPRIHGNSLDYSGPTHVYVIHRNGVPYKVGESTQGVRAGDGASIRAESQVRQRSAQTGDRYTSRIIANTDGKRSARQFETYMIDNYRQAYGPQSLPGNKVRR